MTSLQAARRQRPATSARVNDSPDALTAAGQTCEPANSTTHWRPGAGGGGAGHVAFRVPALRATLEEAPVSTAEPVAAPGPPIDQSVTNRSLAVRARSASNQPQSAVAPPAVLKPIALNEQTLAGTKWGQGAFSLEFGHNGKLLMGGREHAQWQVQGSRIRLYRGATGEEHWLDIVGDKLMWEGQEISRVP